MNPDAVKMMQEFEELKLQEKSVKEKIEVLKELLMPHVEEGKKYTMEKGVIEVKSRPVWTFSPALAAEKDVVQAKEAEEIAKGIAENRPTVYIEFRANKVE